MKRTSLAALAVMLFVFSCQKQDAPAELKETEMEISERRCAAMEVLQQQMAADPSLRQRMDAIEEFTTNVITRKGKGLAVTDTLVIPVAVHVIYNAADQNLSLARVQSQIDVLNEDFQKKNADASKVPTNFQDELTSMPVKFLLDTIIRKKTNKKSWGTNDAVKKSSMGGSDPIDPAHHLNMWSCNLGQGLLGYAQFPGGNPSTDGVVILYSAFGSRNKVSGGTWASNYDLGRTATHEVGHWMSLRHIWGDATCGNDFVWDTPTHNTANYGCPSFTHTSTCSGQPLEMWMNYMDYTYDRCMFMFSNGQRDRGLAIFEPGGPRASFR
ncbi:MAG TPA: zinc metalloprotease [Flavisolibacter sp.]